MRAVLQAGEDLLRLAPFQNQGDGRALRFFGFVGAAVGGGGAGAGLGTALARGVGGGFALAGGFVAAGAFAQSAGANIWGAAAKFDAVVHSHCGRGDAAL